MGIGVGVGVKKEIKTKYWRKNLIKKTNKREKGHTPGSTCSVFSWNNNYLQSTIGLKVKSQCWKQTMYSMGD